MWPPLTVHVNLVLTELVGELFDLRPCGILLIKPVREYDLDL